MAKPIKRGRTWRVEICVAGVRESFSAPHRATCEIWAADRRRELLAIASGQVVGGKTLAQALERFSAEVSANRRGARWEQVRLKSWAEKITLAGLPLSEITPELIAEWRDERLKTVKPGSVLRDFALLSAVFEHCRREWRWITSNPLRDVRKPSPPKSRERRVTDAELELIHAQLGDDVRSVRGRIWLAAVFALHTGMRVGEICALQWRDVGEKSCRVTGEALGAGKTDQAARDVPLDSTARQTLKQLHGLCEESVFLLKKGSVDALWRMYVKAAGLSDLHFHDLRHECVTRIAGANKLDVMSLARMIGHADTKMLLRYYNPSADDLADRLG